MTRPIARSATLRVDHDDSASPDRARIPSTRSYPSTGRGQAPAGSPSENSGTGGQAPRPAERGTPCSYAPGPLSLVDSVRRSAPCEVTVTPDQRRARASIAARTRHRPDDPTLDDARRALRASRLRSRITAELPALSVDQRAELAELLRGTGAAA